MPLLSRDIQGKFPVKKTCRLYPVGGGGHFSPLRYPSGSAIAATQGPENAKGGKISPAARRFPLSLFRETVKPPLFVPVLRNRLLSQLCKGKTRGFGPGEYRLDDIGDKTVQRKNTVDVTVFLSESL